jgi:hypothetical protein
MKKITLMLLAVFTVSLYSQTPGSESAIINIAATIPYQGFDNPSPLLGSGEYKIFYDNIDGELDKPIFFVDGFDPNDSRKISDMYSLLDFGNSGENLADIVRDEGYDLIVLNFPEEYFSPTDGTTVIRGGADYIQRNAYVLVELINTINGLKELDAEQSVIIGPSMGGLISRYALAYMENQSMAHDMRLYISFDSPHLGANVPIGVQYTFNYLVNGDPGLIDLEPVISGLLNSAAAKQMLIDHYLGHVDAGGVQQNGTTHTPKGAPNFRDAFQSELDGLGFPQNSRNIAISNGSGMSQMTGSPGMELINHVFNIATGTDATIDIHFTPLASQNIAVSDIGITFFSIPLYSFSASSESTPVSDGIDSAPGGQFDLYSFDDGSNPLVTEFVANLNSQYFNFIPTLSSAAISSEPNWYASPDANDSPFDSVFFPNNNEPHVMLTNDNVAFALDEIRETLGVTDDHKISNAIRLEKNPIDDELVLLNHSNTRVAHLQVVDVTGKMVYENSKLMLNERTSIPINLATGLYILNAKINNQIHQIKLVVN